MKSPIVVSFGGGDNSRALLIEMHRRSVRPDLILFADTGGELPETYANVAEFSAWLISRGFPPVETVREERQTLEAEVRAAHTLPSIAFGFRSCSEKYKVRPQHRYLKKWQPAVDAWAAGGKVLKLIGYDAGETHRLKEYSDSRFVVDYPLAHWGGSRVRCSEEVRAAGLSPGKSACFFCPSSRRAEVLALAKSHPELMARALEMERNATAATAIKGLGRHWRWADVLTADAAQMRLFPDAGEVLPCGCYDGGGGRT